MLELKLAGTPTSEEVKSTIEEVGDFGEEQIVSTSEGTFLVRMKLLSEEEHAKNP